MQKPNLEHGGKNTDGFYRLGVFFLFIIALAFVTTVHIPGINSYSNHEVNEKLTEKYASRLEELNISNITLECDSSVGLAYYKTCDNNITYRSNYGKNLDNLRQEDHNLRITSSIGLPVGHTGSILHISDNKVKLTMQGMGNVHYFDKRASKDQLKKSINIGDLMTKEAINALETVIREDKKSLAFL